MDLGSRSVFSLSVVREFDTLGQSGGDAGHSAFRPLTESQGRLIFVSSIARSVSARCLLIHPDASCSELNLPKYLVVPLGHLICTRQRSPFFTDVKMVLAPLINTIIATFNWTGKS